MLTGASDKVSRVQESQVSTRRVKLLQAGLDSESQVTSGWSRLGESSYFRINSRCGSADWHLSRSFWRLLSVRHTMYSTSSHGECGTAMVVQHRVNGSQPQLNIVFLLVDDGVNARRCRTCRGSEFPPDPVQT